MQRVTTIKIILTLQFNYIIQMHPSDNQSFLVMCKVVHTFMLQRNLLITLPNKVVKSLNGNFLGVTFLLKKWNKICSIASIEKVRAWGQKRYYLNGMQRIWNKKTVYFVHTHNSNNLLKEDFMPFNFCLVFIIMIFRNIYCKIGSISESYFQIIT